MCLRSSLCNHEMVLNFGPNAQCLAIKYKFLQLPQVESVNGKFPEVYRYRCCVFLRNSLHKQVVLDFGPNAQQLGLLYNVLQSLQAKTVYANFWKFMKTQA